MSRLAKWIGIASKDLGERPAQSLVALAGGFFIGFFVVAIVTGF